MFGKYSLVIRPPEAATRFRIAREGDDAAGGSADECDAGFEVCVAGGSGQCAESTGIGVDKAGGYFDFDIEAKLGRGLFRQPAKACADLGGAFRQAGFFFQIFEAGKFQVVAFPTRRLMRQIVPFGRDSAAGALSRSGRLPGEEVGQIEDETGFFPAFRPVLLQPFQFRHFHFGRQRAAGEIKNMVAGSGEFVGFADGAVIVPDDRILFRETGGGDGERLAVPVAHDERTGGVEADRGDT
ncbi:hypothetical protein D3C71_1207440 [compost metagenome]